MAHAVDVRWSLVDMYNILYKLFSLVRGGLGGKRGMNVPLKRYCSPKTEIRRKRLLVWRDTTAVCGGAALEGGMNECSTVPTSGYHSVGGLSRLLSATTLAEPWGARQEFLWRLSACAYAVDAAGT